MGKIMMKRWILSLDCFQICTYTDMPWYVALLSTHPLRWQVAGLDLRLPWNSWDAERTGGRAHRWDWQKLPWNLVLSSLDCLNHPGGFPSTPSGEKSHQLMQIEKRVEMAVNIAQVILARWSSFQIPQSWLILYKHFPFQVIQKTWATQRSWNMWKPNISLNIEHPYRLNPSIENNYSFSFSFNRYFRLQVHQIYRLD